jgi:probable phosphoglycerate mutase
MAGPTIVFIRHGETDWNREERFQGQRDIPLNALGRRQAERNGRAVAGILAAGDWRLIASPLGRTVETMQIALAAAGRAGASFTTDSRLKEASFGDWEGLTLTEITAGQPDFARQRELDKWGFVPPSGESYSMLAERIDGWVRTVDAPTLVVGHGGVLRALCICLPACPRTTPRIWPPRRTASSSSPARPVLTI